MPFEITMDGIPGGYSINAARDGEMVQIQCREFSSSEDGQDFIAKLEGLPNEILRYLPPEIGIRPSKIDSLLAIIRRDRTATVYINELPFIVQAMAGRDIKPGMPVGKDDVADIVSLEVKGKLPAFLAGWDQHPTFADHMPILRRAADHFLGDDYLSCTGLLIPRIEGLLRSNHTVSGCVTKPAQKSLSASAVQPKLDQEKCLLLPHRFQQFLEKVYFAAFDSGDTSISVSRNSVGHGVASAACFDEKAAVIGLLVVQQFLFCFERPAHRNEEPAAVAVNKGPPVE